MKNRTFTIRLSSSVSAALQELKEMTGQTSDNAAIRFAISTYKELHIEFSELSIKMRRLESELESHRRKIKTFVAAFDELQAIE